MSIQILGDLLFEVFRYIDSLDDLVSCSAVCRKWRQITAKRLNYVHYLLDELVQSPQDPEVYDTWPRFYYLDTVYVHKNVTLRRDSTLEFLNNIRIIAISDPKFEFPEVLNLVMMHFDKIKGLSYIAYHHESCMFTICPNLEMFSSNGIETFMVFPERGNNITQLHLEGYDLAQFITYVNFFPFLRRLHIDNYEAGDPLPSRPSPLHHLEILELESSPPKRRHPDSFKFALNFIDAYCISMKSCYITCNSLCIPSPSSMNIPNLDLENLVLYLDHDFEFSEKFRQSLHFLLYKFPKLKNLALRNLRNVIADFIEDIVNMLPHLLLFDIRAPHASISAFDLNAMVDNFAEHGRIIFIYHYFDSQIEANWPQYTDRFFEGICPNFNFMKHCFLREPHQLPLLMDFNAPSIEMYSPPHDDSS